MDDAKTQLLRWIDEDREEIVGFLCDFVRAKSPNPPGDTTLAAAHVTRFLERNGLPFRIIAPQPTMPNIVGTFEGARPATTWSSTATSTSSPPTRPTSAGRTAPGAAPSPAARSTAAAWPT